MEGDKMEFEGEGQMRMSVFKQGRKCVLASSVISLTFKKGH